MKIRERGKSGKFEKREDNGKGRKVWDSEEGLGKVKGKAEENENMKKGRGRKGQGKSEFMKCDIMFLWKGIK